MIEAHVTFTHSGTEPEVMVGFLPTAPFENAEEETRNLPGLDDPDRTVPTDDRASRAEVVATHVLAHAMLAKCAGCSPESIRLRRSPLGRPEVAAPEEALKFQFSITHADGLAVCAVTTGAAVGTGIESLRSVGPDPMAVAELSCSADEQEALRLTPPEARTEHLIAFWSIKEAIAKALGPGQLPLDEIDITPREDGTTLIRWGKGVTAEQSVWRLISMKPTQRHVATVAVPIANLSRNND